jgi:uncharacterized protein YraI
MKTLLTTAALAVALTSPVLACQVSDPTGTPLNMRESPNGKIIGTLQNGVEVVMKDASKDWNWAQIVTKSGKTGWVYYNYLSDCDPAEVPGLVFSGRVLPHSK